MNKQLSNKDTKWLEGKHASTDALTSALDSLYATGPNPDATRLAKLALHNRLSYILSPIYYDRMEDTPLGPLWVAVGPKGLVAVAYDGSEENVRDYLGKHVKGRPQRSASEVAEVKKQVRSYLLGHSDRWNLNVDLSSTPPFQRRVLEEIRKIPRGQVSTYAEIARRIGQPKAVRAVGQALRNNPIPIVVPCHRIIASDGTLGGYGGRLRDRRKMELLKLEGATWA